MTVDSNFKWFKENKDSIIQKYSISQDDYLVICDQKVVTKSNNYYEVLIFAEKNLSDKKYIIQKLSDLNSKNNSLGYVGTLWYAKNN